MYLGESLDDVNAATVPAAAGLDVPVDVAVVGVDDDELLCNLCNPPLSSVALSTYQGGYNAATVLDRMMAGEDILGRESILIEPVEVITRASSDILAINDHLVAEAVRCIREQYARGVSVEQVAERLSVSRRKLEISFKRTLHRSVHEEVRRVQLAKVCELLLATGFKTPQYLSQVFHTQKGMTLRMYRKTYRNPCEA